MMGKCSHYDSELDICKLHSDWSEPMPVLHPCVDGACDKECEDNMPIRNYDRIRNMSIDEMAELFYGIIHERDLHIMKALGKKGIDASLIEFSPETHISYHKQWLESEAVE